MMPELDRFGDPMLVAATLLGFDLPAECVPGVAEALAALAGHWANVAAFAVPEPDA